MGYSYAIGYEASLGTPGDPCIPPPPFYGGRGGYSQKNNHSPYHFFHLILYTCILPYYLLLHDSYMLSNYAQNNSFAKSMMKSIHSLQCGAISAMRAKTVPLENEKQAELCYHFITLSHYHFIPYPFPFPFAAG